MMKTAAAADESPRRHRLRAWTWHRPRSEWDGGRPSRTVRNDDERVHRSPVKKRRGRCRSADGLSTSNDRRARLNVASPHFHPHAGPHVFPSPFKAIRRRQGTATAGNVSSDDDDDDSHQGRSSTETELDPPSLASTGATRMHDDHSRRHHPTSSWGVQVAGGVETESRGASTTSSSVLSVLGRAKPKKSVKPTSSAVLDPAVRFSTPQLLDEDRCHSPTQPHHYLHAEESAVLKFSSSFVRRHRVGWWAIILVVATLMVEDPVDAAALLIALPFFAALHHAWGRVVGMRHETERSHGGR